MSTPASQALRDGIRSGAIRCRRPSEGGECDPRSGEHERGCTWNNAVIRIYEIERAAEGEPHPGVVDWPELLHELRRAGFHTGSIAEHTELGASTLREYRAGVSTPLHANGERLIRFWAQALGKDRAQLPIAPPQLSAASVR